MTGCQSYIADYFIKSYDLVGIRTLCSKATQIISADGAKRDEVGTMLMRISVHRRLSSVWARVSARLEAVMAKPCWIATHFVSVGLGPIAEGRLAAEAYCCSEQS